MFRNAALLSFVPLLVLLAERMRLAGRYTMADVLGPYEQTLIAWAPVHSIAARGARRVGVLTPYVQELNDKIRASLEQDGLEVDRIHGMGIADNAEIGEVGPARIADTAADAFEDADVELLFVSCTNLRAMEARRAIQNRLKVPVVTSNHAALEALDGALARPTAG